MGNKEIYKSTRAYVNVRVSVARGVAGLIQHIASEGRTWNSKGRRGGSESKLD